MAIASETLGSEAFFGRTYYSRWLTWIENHARVNPSASLLNDWLVREKVAIEVFVTEYVKTHPDRASELRILDLGCGFGRHIIQLLAQHPDITAVGIDINASMINEATWEAKNRGLSNRAVFLLDDMSKLASCEPREFDLAICMTNTIGNLPDKKQLELVRRVETVLRPGGRLLVSAYSHGSVKARLESYRLIGLTVEERGSSIIAAEGLESEAFSETDLRRLLAHDGMRLLGGIESLTDIAWKAVAERP